MSWFLPRALYWFYTFLTFTWRIRIHEHASLKQCLKDGSPFILAHWHGDEIAVLHLVRNYRLTTMTSTSQDGALIDFVIRRMGGDTSRGSSTRGGISALKGLVRFGRKGRAMSLAVDGPRGPIYQPKPGVFELSRLCHAPIFPVGAFCNSAYVFEKAWNRAYLPYPFAKIEIVIGEPMPALEDSVDPKSLMMANDLAERINGTKRQAAKEIATR